MSKEWRIFLFFVQTTTSSGESSKEGLCIAKEQELPGFVCWDTWVDRRVGVGTACYMHPWRTDQLCDK